MGEPATLRVWNPLGGLARPFGWRSRAQVILNDRFLTDSDPGFIAAVFGIMAACPRHRFIFPAPCGPLVDAWVAWQRDDAWPEPIGSGLLSHAARELGNGSDADQERWYDRLCNIVSQDGVAPWPLPNVRLPNGPVTAQEDVADA